MTFTIESALPRVRMVCIAENGEYTSTDSFKYCARVIHKELLLAFDYHSLRHPYVKPATKNIFLKAEISNYQVKFDSLRGFLFRALFLCHQV